MSLMTRVRRETCPTCQQIVVPPTPSKVVLVRLGMAMFAVGSGLVEYRRALKRELEAARLEQMHNTGVDVPLDEHLEQREPPARDQVRTVDLYANGEHVASSELQPTPWPPAHPSLAADDDATEPEQ